MRRLLAGLVLLGATLAVSAANASQVIGSGSVSGVELAVNGKGQALLSYTVDGRAVHVLASGAVNAVAPTAHGRQVALSLAYGRGARTGAFTCPSYTGPALADMLAACTAPDGSDWAVQSWDRDLPSYGVTPTPAEARSELHLAHWTGALPVLAVHADWAYRGRWNHLWGTYTYDGGGVYGFRLTAAGVPLDSFGRNVYLDTYDSAYGPGWKRLNSLVTHAPGGSWCYLVSPHGTRPAGAGSSYRLTVIGPGVTPDLSVTVPAPGPYSKSGQASDDAALRALDDPRCAVR